MKKLSLAFVLGIIIAIVACDGGVDTVETSLQAPSADVLEVIDTSVPSLNIDIPKAEIAKGYMTEYEHDPRRNLPVSFKEEADSWTPVPVDHKSACGDADECTDVSDCPAPTDSCETTGCSLSGCCVTAPVQWNCCHTDDDCGPNSACLNNVCEEQDCTPYLVPNVPVGCVADVRLFLHHCYFLAWDTPDCNQQRPTECHVSEDCWPDSQCNSGMCERLTCFGKYDEGCYEPGTGPVAMDWECRVKLYPQGTLCDDGDPATTLDTCHAGKCLGVGLASQDSP